MKENDSLFPGAGHFKGLSVWHDGRPREECDACKENLEDRKLIADAERLYELHPGDYITSVAYALAQRVKTR